MKRTKKLLIHLCSVLFILITLQTPIFGYAVSEPEVLPEPEPPVVEEDEDTLIPVGDPFTPEGNMTMVDDIFTNNEGDKQFITAVTKTGNWIYLVIDRANEGANNVYLLNMIDEADIMALITGESVNASFVPSESTTETITPEPEPEPEPEDEPEPEPEVATETTEKKGSVLPFLMVLILLGGGVYVYLNKQKEKNDDSVSYSDPDDEEDDYFDIEASDVENEK